MKAVLKSLVVISLAASVSVAVAATSDGSLVTGSGATNTGSTGSFDINVTKQDSVQISNLNAITITQGTTAVAPVVGSDTVCYYATTNNYTITIDSTNTTAFSLTNGASGAMAYTLDWVDTAASVTKTWGAGNIADGVASAAIASANKTSANCGGSTNASISVTIPAATFNSAPTGVYTDTVNVTIVGI
jgi:hypothetical protein